MTHLRLRYTIEDEPVVAPTDILNVRAAQSIVLAECTECGWRSQPFKFHARTLMLVARSHFLGHQVNGLVKRWACNRRT